MRSFKLIAVLLAAAALAALAPSWASGAEELALGSRGKAVKVVQRRLGLPADGIFGRRTERAVKRFQRRRGLAVSGRVDTATRRALFPRGTESTSGGAESPDGDVDAMVEAAESRLGSPYKAGAAGPGKFDCSGLTQWAAAAAGFDLPRSSFQQYEIGTRVARDAIEAGDLVFFDTAGPGASDVGVATSPSTVISATTHGVREHGAFGDYWGDHYVGARRIG